MTSQKVTLKGILDSLAEEYDVDITDTAQETISESDTITPKTKPDIKIKKIEIDNDLTRISATVIDKLRDHSGTINLNEEYSIICNGREGIINLDDETVKYVINKNIVYEINGDKVLFDFIILYYNKYQTFSGAHKSVRVSQLTSISKERRAYRSQYYYHKFTEDETIQKAIRTIKETEFFHLNDKT